MAVAMLASAGVWPKQYLPLFRDPVSAGFPSPAQDYVEQALDLNELCVKRPAATFFLRVEGDSMRDAGIYPNDVLVVDRSLTAQHGDVVIAAVNGEFTVKQLSLKPCLALLPCNESYAPIELQEGSELEVFGVVTSVVRTLKRASN
jgi:DNA polymerase V